MPNVSLMTWESNEWMNEPELAKKGKSFYEQSFVKSFCDSTRLSPGR